MRGLFGMAVATAAGLVGQSLARPLVVNAGDVSDIVITAENTVNATAVASDPVILANPLKFTVHHNQGGLGQLYAYVTGKDSSGAVVMLTSSGTWYYPNPGGSQQPIEIPADAGHAIPLNGEGSTTDFTIPDYMSSGRVWISEGQLKFYTVLSGDGLPALVEPSAVNPSDPSSELNWGFVELTNNERGIYANISFVDFIGLIISMRLTLGSGDVQTVEGLAPGAVAEICTGLTEQAAKDGQPWDQMCRTSQSGTPLRVLAPNMYVASNPGSMDSYYTDYVDQVWAKYSNEDLIIDTQSGWGQVPCRVSGDDLVCQGDSMAYPKPTIVDIWGCNSGPFVNHGDELHKLILARLCAAFHRTELLLPGGNVTPSLGAPGYYTTDPTSHYSRLVHEHETDKKGYAFSYDDVNPNGENAAGVVSGENPQVLELFLGGI